MGKRAAYTAESPERIISAFKKYSSDAEKLGSRLAAKREKVLPNHIQYLKGFDGIRAVFDDVIERTPKGGTFYRYTSELDVDKVNKYLSSEYRTRRDAKKLERLVISNPISGKSKRPRLERFVKFIPPEVDLFNQNIIQLVYADSLAFINLTNEEAFIIRDQDLSRFQAVIFNQLYKKLAE